MGVVKMNVDALASAKTELENLAGDIETSRNRCLDVIPDRVSVESLWGGRTLATLPTWLREQKSDPIGVVLDLARLLDADDDGLAEMTAPNGPIDFTDALTTEISRQIGEVDDPDELAALMALLERQGNNVDRNEVLKQLLERPDPGPLQVDTITQLALPEVDATGGETDAESIIDAMNDTDPEGVAEGWDTSAEINAGLALLKPWAERNGIDLGEQSRVQGAVDYQSSFIAGLEPHRDDLMAFMKSDKFQTGTRTETVERKRRVGMSGFETYEDEVEVPVYTNGLSDTERGFTMTTWADTILNVSNEDNGGGWDRLPESMRDDVHFDDSFWGESNPGLGSLPELLSHASGPNDLPEGAAPPSPGDQFAVNLAHSVQGTLFYDEHTVQGAPTHPPNEGALGDMLGLIGRNLDATNALLAGDNGALDEDGAALPENYDRNDFVTDIYTHPWADDGEAAAGLTDGVNEVFKVGESHPDWDDANSAYNGLTSTLANNEDGVLQDLLDAHDGNSVGKVNPGLMQGLAEVTGHQHILEDMATTESANAAPHAQLMMLIAGDDDAYRYLSGATTAYSADQLNSGETPDGVARRIGFLNGLMESGAYNEAYERTDDKNEAEQARADQAKFALSLVSGALPGPDVTDNPVAQGALEYQGSANTILGQFINAGNPAPAEPNVSPNWEPNGSHIEVAIYDYMARDLVADGEITQSEYESLQQDFSTNDDAVGAYKTLLEQNGVETIPDDMTGDYTNQLGYWTADSKEPYDDFIEHDTAPGPG